MKNLLSYIIGFRARRARIEAAIEERAKHLFLKMLVEHEQETLAAQHLENEEKKKLSDAWMPFNPRRLTKGQAKALTLFDDAALTALEVVGEEMRAELSNRAMLTDGVTHDRAMYTMLGIKMFMQTVRQKIDHFGGQQKREKAKKSAAAKMEPKETPRSVMDLYGDQLIKV